ncbi:hypothetical protein PIB30_086523 [Stylosanthes scabra]|uniref:Uncharacterized protein n=1 Tax=Stylosanthes scabra TaxID=79078 RepID=A0ABU6URZ3_9FABA|nr:hypothetical protein [Stylosanthes scabra]
MPPPHRQYQTQPQGWRDYQQNRCNSNQQQPPQYCQPYTANQQQNSQNQRYQPPHTRQAYPTNFPVNTFLATYEEALQTFQQENKEMREAQKRTKTQLTNLIELLTKFTNQVTVNPQTSSQPSSPSPLPFQPLPNPKGGINMVRKEKNGQDKEGSHDEWLLELISKLAKLNESDEEEESEDEDESEEEDMEKEDDKETFFIAIVFRGNKTVKNEIPAKCADPGPCLVTCKIRGGDKGGTPQVLLGRPSLKISSFQLDYVDETFSFKVGHVIEIFHQARPVAPRKKSAQQMQLCNDEVRRENAPIEAEGRKSESSMDEIEKDVSQ